MSCSLIFSVFRPITSLCGTAIIRFPAVYLVNKPLRAAGMSANNVRGEEIVPKMNVWPRSEVLRANMKF